MMSILGCLDRPTAGRYLFEGVDVARALGTGTRAHPQPAHRLRVPEFQPAGAHQRARERRVAAVLFERCTAACDANATERARHALELLGLGHRAGNTPAQLSGGEQQRVAIARALINAPSVLLADEPTGNLDTKNSHDIMQTLVRFNREQGVTVVVVTHEPDIAAYADRVITMRDGGVVSDRAARLALHRNAPGSRARRRPSTQRCGSRMPAASRR